MGVFWVDGVVLTKSYIEFRQSTAKHLLKIVLFIQRESQDKKKQPGGGLRIFLSSWTN